MIEPDNSSAEWLREIVLAGDMNRLYAYMDETSDEQLMADLRWLAQSK